MLRLLGRFLMFLFIISVVAVGVMYVLWGMNLPQVSSLDVIELGGKTRIYDSKGKLIGTLHPSLGSGRGINHDLLSLQDISPSLIKAVITSEDRRFYKHFGIDPIGMGRGLIKGLLKNDLEGGSTITQQVIKNTLLSDLNNARTVERKFKEAILSFQLERDFSKEKILNAYLNVIYWGDGGKSIVGISNASWAYFRKNPGQLNLAESVYLATLIPAPNRRYKDFRAYRPLMKSLLNRMVRDGRITQEQANKAWRTPIYPAGWRIAWNPDGSIQQARLENPKRLQTNLAHMKSETIEYRSFLQAVERELLQKLTPQQIYGGGKIYTSMDIQAQRAAEQASRNAQLPNGATLGMAFLNPYGEVRALVGQSLRLSPQEWNNAIQAKRQVGSSLKPLLYTMAIARGWKQNDTLLDAPLSGEYQPSNYNKRWSGRYVTLRYALNHSLNLPTVRMGNELGIRQFAQQLRDLGLEPTDTGPSLSIGTLEASPLQMAAAYVPFMNGGIWYEPHAVRQFEDKSGRIIYKHQPRSRRIWDAQTAWIGLDMLRGVVNDLNARQGGLASKARIPGWEVGGKTGTTNDIKDLWFVGVTPLLSGAVWVGKPQNGSLPSWAYSGDIPTPIWQQTISGALAGKTGNFKEPSGIRYRVIRQINMAFRAQEVQLEAVQRNQEEAPRQRSRRLYIPPVRLQEEAEPVMPQYREPYREMPQATPIPEPQPEEFLPPERMRDFQVDPESLPSIDLIPWTDEETVEPIQEGDIP